MKKILLIVIVTVMTTMNVNAQEEWKNEVSIAYGAGSNTNIVGSFYKGVFTGKQLNYWGPISLEYFRRLESSNRLGIGAVATLSGCKWDDENNARSTFISIMPAVKYNWSVGKHVSWYSKAAFGLHIAADSGSKDDKTKLGVNWQATFVGVEFGSAFRVFAELGTGEQGIFLGGLRYKF